jgi:hypothetical protein
MACRYHLFFASLAPSQEPGGQPTVVAGQLNPDLVKILGTAKSSKTLRALIELFNIASSAAGASFNRLDADAAFGSEMIDGVFTAGLRDFNWMHESLNAPQTASSTCFVSMLRPSSA